MTASLDDAISRKYRPLLACMDSNGGDKSAIEAQCHDSKNDGNRLGRHGIRMSA